MHLLVACATLFFSSLLVASPTTQSLLRLDPHSYSSSRSGESTNQVTGLLGAKVYNEDSSYPWHLSFHLEAETAGKRDASLDVDRAWVQIPLNKRSVTSPVLLLGRIHPYDVASHPDAKRPWSLIGSNQPQNLGLLIGYGYGEDPFLPSPLLLGWVGAHYWSDVSRTDLIQYGISATPFFVPSMGSEIAFSGKDPRFGRFGRRPPGTVLINDREYPISFELDKSRVFEDIIFHPQVGGTLHVQSDHINPEFETVFTLFRTLKRDPEFSTEEYLVIEEDGISAFAKVHPKFNYRTLSTLTGRWNFYPAMGRLSLFSSVLVGDDNRWGYELGVEGMFFSLAFSDERSFKGATSTFSTNEKPYGEYLLQGEGRLPLDTLTLFSGAKRHLSQEDLWLYSGVRFPLADHIQFATMIDVFGGPDFSYFGEWRTNDRISAVLTWELGS